MTECTLASHLPLLNLKDHYLGVNKVIANFEQKIIDSTGNEVPSGERGEVLNVKVANISQLKINEFYSRYVSALPQ